MNKCTKIEAFSKDYQIVSYEQFGAVGNGVNDDTEAIRKAHTYANENGLKVVG